MEKISANVLFLVIGILIGGIITAISGYYAQCKFKEYENREINKPILMLGRALSIHRNQGERKIFIDYAVRNEGENTAIEYQVNIDGKEQEKQMILARREIKEFNFYGDISSNSFFVKINYKDVFGNYYETFQKVLLTELNGVLTFQKYDSVDLARKR